MKKSAYKYIVISLVAGALIFTGCQQPSNQAPPLENPPVENGEGDAEQQKIMEEFKGLIATSPAPSEAHSFIEGNIEKVSKEDASIMVQDFEALQNKYQPQLNEEFFESEDVQLQLLESGLFEFDYESVDQIQDERSKDLLLKTMDNGFKVETAEAQFFPVIDYSFYKKYSEYVTDDIKEYIEIMAADSDDAPIKDAAIVIGWDEVANRTAAAEDFLSTYPDSPKYDEMKQLYLQYADFLLFGSANTPAFDFSSNVLRPELQKSYEDLIQQNPDSKLSADLKIYYDVLQENEFILTDESEKAREELSAKITG